jgi:hypothetical protein
MIKRAIAVATGIALSLCGTALGRDSGHWVCSAVTEFQADGNNSPIGISIVLDDWRAPGGRDRIRVLSWVYGGKLFQGSVRDATDSVGLQGNVAIKNGKNQLYAGAFRLKRENDGQPDERYALVLDGKITDDPASTTLHPIKATLPCVNLSI